jgi:AAA domain
VVVLDTLNKSLAGSESKDVDMAAYIRAAEVIRDAFKCVVIIIRHCGWDETRPRGHSSLPGAVDAQIAIVREGSVMTATVEYMRDGPEDVHETSTAKSVPVGEDQKGKELSSLVLVPGGDPVTNGKGRNGGLTDNEAIALKHSAKMSVKEPEPVPEGLGLTGLKGASLVQWQARVTRAIWNNITDKSHTEMLKLQRALQRKDQIDTDGEIVWFSAPEK